jgi:phosphatidate phosphatase PAH1
MSSNPETKSRPTIHSEGRDINKVIQFFDQEKTNGNLKLPTENATEHAAAATGKSEAIICKIRKEATMASIGGEKLKSPCKTRKPSAKRIEPDDFDFCVIKKDNSQFLCCKERSSNIKICIINLEGRN